MTNKCAVSPQSLGNLAGRGTLEPVGEESIRAPNLVFDQVTLLTTCVVPVIAVPVHGII
jgi:hypothetical protein